jgi:uncharacterized membrane protein
MKNQMIKSALAFAVVSVLTLAAARATVTSSTSASSSGSSYSGSSSSGSSSSDSSCSSSSSSGGSYGGGSYGGSDGGGGDCNNPNNPTPVPEASTLFPLIGLIVAILSTTVMQKRRAAQLGRL